MPRRKLGSYEILREIGQGGMGVVYLALQPSLARYVVLKKIRRDLLRDANVVNRFKLEARAAAAIQHQNVVAVHDCFSHRGDQYIAQELVNGKDLLTILSRVRRIDPGVAMIVALEAARGLEEIHAKGIVHRDLKPANILVGGNGEVKIADFGIALGGSPGVLTRPGTLLGSVPYMSPEQMRGQRVDHRSDLFSFGVLLYEMLSGSPPYRAPSGDSLEPLLEAMRDERYDPVRRHVAAPRSAERLIRGCLRFKPSRRVPNATELRRLLERRVGPLPPSECRRVIASYFVGRRVFRASSERTSIQPAQRRRRARRTTSRLILAVLVSGLLLIGSAALARWLSSARVEQKQAEPLAPDRRAANAGPEATREVELPVVKEQVSVRFAAFPWARVHLPDGTSFETPRAAPVVLESGQQRVVFEHPRFGRVEYTLDLVPGEQPLIRHVYEEALRR